MVCQKEEEGLQAINGVANEPVRPVEELLTELGESDLLKGSKDV